MPFITNEDQEIALGKVMGFDQVETDVPFNEQVKAAFRLENTVGSFLSKEGNLPDNYVSNPNFNPLDHATDEERLDDRFMSNISLADNTDEIESVRTQLARERSDQDKLETGGFVPIAIAAILDPINLIPVGGVAYKTYRAGASILKAGVITGGASAVSATATEAGLHYSQMQRTWGESAVNVTAAALLGGVLGATPSAVRELLGRAGHDADKALKDIEDSMSPEQVIDEGGNPVFAGELRSVGAAEVLTDVNIRGKLAKAVTKFVGFDPLSRTITSDSSVTRTTSINLAENPIDMDRPIGTSVESTIKTKQDGAMFEGIDNHLKLFKRYKGEDGLLSRRDFNIEVGKAVRNGSTNKTVQEAADSWNKKVYEPLKKEAIEAKILPEDVGVTTAKNYLNRLWKKEKIAADLPNFVAVTSKWLMNQNPKLDSVDADDLASQIAGRLMSTPDGRLPYDYQLGETSSTNKSLSNSKLKGVFKSRTFNINDDLVEDFLENDIELLAARYVKNTVPDIELMKAFDDVEMKAELKAIEDDWIAKIKAEPNPKIRGKMNKKKDKDVQDIAAMRDRLRGTYNISDPNNPWVRTSRVMRDLNYMRLLGGVVASSIPDVGKIIMAEGIVNVFRHGLRPLVKNISSFKMAANEAKLYGVGTDALMGGRAEIIADTVDYAAGGTAFERGVRSAATKFSSINLMNQWTAGVKQLHAVVTQTRIADELLKGAYDKRLGQLGISEADAFSIGKQIKKHGEKMDGTWVINTKDWDNPALIGMWRTAIRKESDRVIIVPGQEKPLFMSNELGKTIFQFKTFMFSATQRILVSSLQAQDKHMMQGVLSMVSLGAMSYAFKQWDAGREISDDPMVLITEGIDRSGSLGILMEMNNTLEKISSNSIGLRSMLGVSAPASRYASRTLAESSVGPTLGLVSNIVKTANAVTGGAEWADSDTRALRRLVPGQNLSFLRQGFDELEKQVNR